MTFVDTEKKSINLFQKNKFYSFFEFQLNSLILHILYKQHHIVVLISALRLALRAWTETNRSGWFQGRDQHNIVMFIMQQPQTAEEGKTSNFSKKMIGVCTSLLHCIGTIHLCFTPDRNSGAIFASIHHFRQVFII